MKKIKVNYSHDNSVATIILDDGKGNVLDRIMMDELQYVFDSFTKKEELKLIVFEGAGANFSFGASVEEHKKEHAAVMLRVFHQLFYSIRDISVPALAKVSGQCLGGGFELALMCNFIFADKSAKFGQPEINLGIIPGFGGTQRLARRIGLPLARELIYSGDMIDAETALRYGLANKVVPLAELMNEAKALARKLATKPPIAIQQAKEAINAGIDMDLDNGSRFENEAFALTFSTSDKVEGMTAFLEKREAKFTGK